MRMNSRFKIVTTILLSFLATIVCAQNKGEDWEEGDIEDAEIIVVKDSKIELPKATRKFEKIDEKVEETKPTEQKYDLQSFSMKLNTLTPRMKVLRIGSDKPKKQYGNYVEAGFGNYITPYLGVYLNSTQDKQSAYGVRFNHISSTNGPVDYSGMSSTSLNLNGDYFMNNASVFANVNYNREGFSYYGFDDEIIQIDDKDSIKQAFNIIDTKIGIKGEAGNLKYSANTILSYLSGKDNYSDFNIGYNAEANYELADKSSIILTSDLILESISVDENTSLNRTYFTFNPKYKFLHDGIHITAGINTAVDDDTLNGAKNFHIYPQVFFNYPLLVNEINVFGGITGGLERNSLTSLLNENRFFKPDSSFVIFNNNNTIEFYGGLKGNFSQKLGYKAQLSYKNYKNLHFFVNEPSPFGHFTIVSDKGNTSLLTFSGELNYEVSKKLTSSLDLTYNAFGISDLKASYFRPSTIVGVNGSYNLMNKATIKAQFNYIQGLKGWDVNKVEVVSLDDIIDLNFELDYKISDFFSSFVMLNNVLGSKYEYYLNYPNKGVNVILGVSYKF